VGQFSIGTPGQNSFGANTRPTLSRIANTPGYVTSTDTIEDLCRFLECTPGELLVLVDDNETDGQKGG